MQRLTHSQITEVRTAQLVAQGGKCALCRLTCKADNAVLDHCHTTGAVRGTLHRSCNALLGKLENNAGRFGVLGHFIEFCSGIGAYLMRHKTNVTGLTHPTHKTDDEKRIKRNKDAVAKRAAARKVKS